MSREARQLPSSRRGSISPGVEICACASAAAGTWAPLGAVGVRRPPERVGMSEGGAWREGVSVRWWASTRGAGKDLVEHAAHFVVGELQSLRVAMHHRVTHLHGLRPESPRARGAVPEQSGEERNQCQEAPDQRRGDDVVRLHGLQEREEMAHRGIHETEHGPWMACGWRPAGCGTERSRLAGGGLVGLSAVAWPPAGLWTNVTGVDAESEAERLGIGRNWCTNRRFGWLACIV